MEAAVAGELPKVLQLKDLRGDLHTHTNLTDGLAPLDEMLQTAATLGYAYYAVTDHAPNLAMQRMTDDKILAQREQLRALQAEHDMTLLHGTELNIDPDGNVDWPEEFLAGFDLTVASIHSHFTQSREELTRTHDPRHGEPVRERDRPSHRAARSASDRRSTSTSRPSSRPRPARARRSR